MKPTHKFTVRPRLPENLSFLGELAYNIWWDWHYDALDLFRRLNRQLWEAGPYNPVYSLLNVEQDRLEYLSREEGFLNHLARVEASYREYMDEPRWFQRNHAESDAQVAYFSMEYGLAMCLPVYSGGLGVLSGDHLKTASDMGLPLVAVGLAYRLGYFHQYLNIDGWQQERYDANDFYSLPVEQVKRADGSWLIIDVPYLTRPVKAAVYRVNVGRVPLYLLSTNLPENRPEDRVITDQLYGGDREMRIRQEIVLGIGGALALQELGHTPSVYHMNEGHSAFLGLTRIRELMEQEGLSYGEAYEAVYASGCFTTHTPVPAGNDVFTKELVEKYLKPLSDELGQSWETFLKLGGNGGSQPSASFGMTTLALRTAAHSNGVSELHGEVSRGMWQEIWPGLPEAEVPVKPITNGVHLHSWISHELATLFDRYLGARWRNDPLQPGLWEQVYEIPDEELWRTHERRRDRLVAFTRQTLARQLKNRGAGPEEVSAASEVLNPETLTIGFARRFATYKRADLLFRDVDRLKELVSHAERPVQFIFAGKAHPRDDEGKKLIREIIHAVRDPELRSRFVFLEDYSLGIARRMVQGVDVWLNTPRRPLEASGTSGMKVVANGGIHLSVLDGWWAEGYHPDRGWAIGSGEEYDDHAYQDEVEGDALYDLLEKDVPQEYYNRSKGNLPREWIARMKHSMAQLIPAFACHRMVREYIEQSYLPAHQGATALAADSYQASRALAGWRATAIQHWDSVRVLDIQVAGKDELKVGDELSLSVQIETGELSPSDLKVEAYCGRLDSQGELTDGFAVEMAHTEGESPAQFSATLKAPHSGSLGFTVRLFPYHASLPHKYALYKVRWAEDA